MIDVVDVSTHLNNMLHKLYQTIFFVDIKQNKAKILQDIANPQNVGKEFNYDDYLLKAVNYLSEEKQKMVQTDFASEILLNKYNFGLQSFSLDYGYIEGKETKCITMTAMLETNEQDEPYAYILVRDTNQDYLLRNVINIYLSHNCDYFLLIEANTDSYTIFAQTDTGTPLPPARSHHYSLEIVKYARAYVVPEDQDMVIEEMKLDRVIDQLDKYGVHKFYAGVVDPVRGYTRKYVEYRYYNRDLKTIILSRTDVTNVYLERQKNMLQLEKALKRAQTDPLTGLLNYHGIVENISDFLEQKNPAGEKLSSLLFLDLDNFKSVNDTYGHQAGDKFLCAVANVLKSAVRKDDLVGRIGGDEFIIFLTRIPTKQDAMHCADRICNEINDLVAKFDYKNVSCSIGIAMSPKDGSTYKQLVAVADKLVYKSKHLGKNRYSI